MTFASATEISQKLDIHEPFLMLDEIETMVPHKRAHGKKRLTKEDWYFRSHLPSIGAMPATLVAESMLQVMAFLINSSNERLGKAIVSKININMLRAVQSGDELDIEVTQHWQRERQVKGSGRVCVGKAVVCTGAFLYSFVSN